MSGKEGLSLGSIEWREAFFTLGRQPFYMIPKFKVYIIYILRHLYTEAGGVLEGQALFKAKTFFKPYLTQDMPATQ